MSILIDQSTRVMIQGITGRLGTLSLLRMRAAGTSVVAGVTPGRRGASVEGIPVHDTVREALAEQGSIDASCLFVPGRLILEGALEAIEAGIKLVLLMVDRLPIHDAMEIIAAAKASGARVLGPNSPGMIVPGKSMIGSLAPQLFSPGPVALLSRSGGMLSTMAHNLGKIGLGQSACVGVGGDPVIGTDLPFFALEAERDPDTKAIAVFAEIGSTQEERLADLMLRGLITKPVVVFVAGVSAKPGVRFSHAGAMIEGGRGAAKDKVEGLKRAGAIVVDAFSQIPPTLKRILGEQAGAGHAA